VSNVIFQAIASVRVLNRMG